jgi:hypothetical protein
MKTAEILANANARNVVAAWDDAHRYTPAPRHRRRLLLKITDGFDFNSVLDTGCAQPFLLRDIVFRRAVEGFGCDISDEVMEANRSVLPACQFQSLDLTQETWPGGRRFDLVICSEVLEHIADWPEAVANLVKMSNKHLLITVPSGPIRTMDRLVGHVQHFQGPELAAELERHGCRIELTRRWGWPLHSLYKSAISALPPDALYSSFSGGERYGFGKRLISEVLYRLFFLNDLARGGHQLIVQARVPDASGRPSPR